MPNERIFLSMIIPAYNEEKRIEKTLNEILSFLRRCNYSHEVIVVDDGSTDRTLDLLKDIQNQHNSLKIIHYQPNQGKGYAVKKGMLNAHGKYHFFCDADLSTPIDELGLFISHLQNGCDVVIGSRKMENAEVRVHQPFIRRKMGQVFFFLAKYLVAGNISDITCGFKCFRGNVARDIFSRQQLHDWSFDAEILFIARKYGYKIKEVPVCWSDVAGSKVKLLRDSIRAFQGLLKIRFDDLKGKYN